MAWLALGPPLRAQDEIDLAEIGKAAVPIVGYDDKSGWLFGAAGFLYNDKAPSINAGLFMISNFINFHSATFNYDQRNEGPFSYTLHLLGERAFDYYYGEGDLTGPNDAKFMRLDHFEVKPTLLYRAVPHLWVGPFADFRSRVEEGSQLFPNESSASYGIHVEWDKRDKLINTRQGEFFQLNLSRHPGEGDDAFVQLALDLRHFSRLRHDLVLGSRLSAGATWGQASYLFRYRLGGLDLLRGYKDNRFRGRDFFVFQEELRWQLKRWLSVNAALDLGDIRDDSYKQLKATPLLGLRIGLPPDFGQKMRIDYSAGFDQTTFQIQFGEIF
jgi:hypothetical protein